MTHQHSIGFASIAEFLVHAQGLEQELAQRYEEMADCLEVHNNFAAATLFRELAEHAGRHTAGLTRRAQDLPLPQVPPWEYQWLRFDEPTSCMEEVHYLMTPYQTLVLALRLERSAWNFYSRTAETAAEEQVRRLADELLNSKYEHLRRLQAWLKREAANLQGAPEDLDPPHMPE